MSPVGTQTLVKRPAFRVASSLLFIVPPFLVQADATASGDWGADRVAARTIGWGVESRTLNHRLTRSRSQVVCCVER